MTADQFKEWLGRFKQQAQPTTTSRALEREISTQEEQPEGPGWRRVGRQWIRTRIPKALADSLAARRTTLERATEEREQWLRDNKF